MSSLESNSTDINPIRRKNRRTMLLVLLAFIIPVLLAKLALDEHWFTYGVTNKGKLLTNKVTLAQMGLDINTYKHKWLMLYLLPKDCNSTCQHNLLGINNTYIALGQGRSRVKPVALTYQALTDKQRLQLTSKQWLIQSIPVKTQQLFSMSQVLIVDPLGNVVLSHIPPKKSELLPSFGKAILADFKKLLKYSRVG